MAVGGPYPTSYPEVAQKALEKLLTFQQNDAKIWYKKGWSLQNLEDYEGAVKGLVALISKDITEIIVLRIINKIQEYIRQGQVEKLLHRSLNGGYNNLNDTNEVIEIFRLVVNSTVDKVLPQVKPEAEALIKYNIEKILSQTPAYQSLLRLPGMKGLKTDLSNRLSSQLYQSFVNIAEKITQEDEVFERLVQQLVQRFGQFSPPTQKNTVGFMPPKML